MRVYLPLTLELLRDRIARGVLAPPGAVVFAVTDALREEYPDSDQEEWEYLAMADAARGSLRLLAGQSPDSWLRVVVAADTDLVSAHPELDRAAAKLDGPLPWRAAAAVHIDGAYAEPTVRRAAEAVDAADLGDLDAEFAVGEVEDIDLAWYAPGEISFLLADLDGSAH